MSDKFDEVWEHEKLRNYGRKFQKIISELQALLEEKELFSDNLCPDFEDDDYYDPEAVFDMGRGQGIGEMCMAIKDILTKY